MSHYCGGLRGGLRAGADDFVQCACSRNLERGGVSERPKVFASKANVG